MCRWRIEVVCGWWCVVVWGVGESGGEVESYGGCSGEEGSDVVLRWLVVFCNVGVGMRVGFESFCGMDGLVEFGSEEIEWWEESSGGGIECSGGNSVKGLGVLEG